MPTKPIRTSDVFVPGKFPVYTYNPRENHDLEGQLERAVDDGGDVIEVVGPTKSGKSVLITKVIDDPISIDGQDLNHVNALWEVIGHELGVEMESEASTREGSAASAELKGKAIFVEGGGSFEASSDEAHVLKRVVAVGPAVRDRLLASQRVVVIEDFHFVDREVQRAVIRALKQLIFKGLIVVVTAISYRRHDAVSAVDDMGGRLATVEIPIWDKMELAKIAEDGFAELNVVDHGGKLGTRLAASSFGSPQIMQRLCRALVRDINEVAARPEVAVDLIAPGNWTAFLQAQVAQESVRWFRKLLKGPLVKGQPRTKWALKSGGSLDTYGLILSALASLDPALLVTTEKLRAAIAELLEGPDVPNLNQVTNSLKHMSRIAAGRLSEPPPAEEDLEDQAADYMGVQPVLEFVEDGAVSELHLADPFFAYFVQWGARSELEAAALPTQA